MKREDYSYFSGQIAYAVAVKRRLQVHGIDEREAIRLLNVFVSTLAHGVERGRFPSEMACDILRIEGLMQ